MISKFWFWWFVWTSILSVVIGLILSISNVFSWLVSIVSFNLVFIFSLVLYVGGGYLVTKLTENNWRV